MGKIKTKLRKIVGWSAVLALIAGLILPALISSQQAQALDLEIGSDWEDSMCEGLEGTFIECADEEGTSFVDYEGEFAPPEADGYAEGITQTSSAREFVVNVTNFVLSFLGLAAVIVVIYGGFLYVTAGGEQERADKGKKSVMYAVMGIVIVLISYALVNTIIQGAAGGEDETSSGSLYSSGGVSSESLSEFQSQAMLDLIKDASEEFVDEYTKFLNVGAILDAMANVGVFNDSGLEEMEEGFNLVLNEIDSYGLTYDEAQDAVQFTERYISGSFLNGLKDWIHASVSLASADDGDSELDACVEACQAEYPSYWSGYIYIEYPSYVGCVVTCGGEESAREQNDPYEIASEVIQYMHDVSANSKADFQNSVSEIVDTLTDMQGSFTDLTAINGFFDTVLDSDHLGGYEGSWDSTTYDDRDFEYTYNTPTSATIHTNTPGGSSQVSEVIDVLNEIYLLVKELQFTTAIISANTKEGNAPLTVTFDGLDSYDPTEATIQSSQYHWDLGGDGLSAMTAEGYTAADDKVGPSVSYTYEEPGTYRVALRVDSNDESNSIASGISYLSIKVNPPSSIINLTAQCQLADCNEDDLTDATEWTITREMASSGVIFDASETTDGANNYDTIVNFDFDYGDGETDSGDSSTVTHYYTAEGEYDFELEVTDQNGIKDRKNIKLVVSSPAADVQIETGAETGEIDDTMTFTAKDSQTDNGTIDKYVWSVTKEGESEVADDNTNSNSPHEYTYTFEDAGVYTVKVEITDSANFVDDDTLQITINSGEPEAVFTYETPDAAHPGRIHFDGSESKDTDTGDNDTLTYEWGINGSEGTDYDFVEGTDSATEAPIIDFYTAQDWEVSLTVYNDYDGDLQKSNSYTRKVAVDSVLSVEAEVDGGSAVFLGEDGTAEITLSLNSNFGVSYEIEWGDATEKETVPVSTMGSAESVTHKYETAGTYPASVIVYDESNAINKVTRNIYVGNGEAPIPIIRVYIDNVESADENQVSGTRISSFRFEGGDSVDEYGNIINESRAFTWDFGDGSEKVHGETHTHKYNEIGTYEVGLTIVSPSDSAKSGTSTITLDIEGAAPEIYSLSAQLSSFEDDLITPVTIELSANAGDEDGSIETYKFWYFDVDNSSEALNTQIASDGNTSLTITTNGTTGEKTTYGFAVEVTDEENNTVSSFDQLTDDQQPTMEIENGTNVPPVADFTVSQTSIMKDDSIVFNSSSYDEDGEIEYYNWDLEGDGFTEDGWTQERSITHVYDYVAKDGIQVRLKVKDDLGATDTSDAVVIYVDSSTKDPVPAFDWGVNPDNDNPLEVTFENKSTADINNGAELAVYEWDFDLSVSTDGDNDTKNDVDSSDANGLDINGENHVYDDFGDYEVRLTVYDDEGNSASIDREIKIVEVDPPEAIFDYVVDEEKWLKVQFNNNSKVGDGAEIESYAWDFDLLNVNSDGLLGVDDDVDSAEKAPSYDYDNDLYVPYTKDGKLTVKVQLTVTDTLGRTSFMAEEIVLEEPKIELDDLEAFFGSDSKETGEDKIYTYEDEITLDVWFGASGIYETPTFCIDQDDDYDSNDNGDAKDDCDPITGTDTVTNLPIETIYNEGGVATFTLRRAWANSANQIKMTLTVKDTATDEIEGQESREDTANLVIQFEDAEEETVPGATSMLPVTNMEALYILAIAMFFTLVGAKIYIGKGVNENLDLDS